jgi:ketosteroid isomerase-like protein
VTEPGDIEGLLARDEIRQLVARYALAVDARDLDALVELFVDDVDVGPYGTGRGALLRSFEESLSSVGITVLHVTTQVVDLVDGHHARGSVYCRGEVQDGDRWLQQSILYSDVYRKDVRWRFVRRRHELFYGAAVGVNPLGLPPANWPEHHDGMGTVPARWESWRRFWEASSGPPPDGRSD